MDVDFNTIFLVLFVMILIALSVSNFVEATKNQQKPFQNFFGLLYLVIAIGLIIYKMQDH